MPVFSWRTLIPFGFLAAGIFLIFTHAKPNQTLIFVSNRTGSYNIWSRNLYTGVLTNLTPSPSNSMNPQISPNHRWLTFYSDRAGGLPQIYTLDLKNPDSVTQLTQTGAGNYDPVYSKDGRYIYFKRTDSAGNFGHLWRMDANGSHQIDLTPSVPATSEVWKPAPVSGIRLIVTIRTRQKDPNTDNLYEFNTMTNTLAQLTHSSLPNWFPAMNPAHGKVAFISKPSLNGHDQIYVMDEDAYGLHRVSHADSADFDDPSWAPDGRNLVCITSQSPGQGYEVVLMDQKGHTSVLDHSPQGEDLSPILIQNR